jgi:hypothetical protein
MYTSKVLFIKSVAHYHVPRRIHFELEARCGDKIVWIAVGKEGQREQRGWSIEKEDIAMPFAGWVCP